MTVTYATDKEYKVPTEGELVSKALAFMKENYSHKRYQSLKNSGELYSLARLKAEASKSYAENLIKSGEISDIAWNAAISQEILERQPD